MAAITTQEPEITIQTSSAYLQELAQSIKALRKEVKRLRVRITRPAFNYVVTRHDKWAGYYYDIILETHSLTELKSEYPDAKIDFTKSETCEWSDGHHDGYWYNFERKPIQYSPDPEVSEDSEEEEEE